MVEDEYHLLSVLLASEVLPKRVVPLGYALTETPDNQDCGLQLLAGLLSNGQITKLGIADPQSPKYNYGYPGPDYCLERLGNMGVSTDKIALVRPEQPMTNINTVNEMEMVVRWMKRENFFELVTASPVFHLLRVYLSTLTALVNLDAINIKAFALGAPVPVYVSVVHSQGVQTGTRADITLAEIRKCRDYPNLISPQRALELHQQHRM